ncbi:MAG: response regulator [Pseudodesulfovibrio sp.]|nr:response regulator [Pseudodesulfovibrio sp.]
MVLLVTLLALAGCSSQGDAPSAVKGVLDLSAWNFERNGPARLFGEWEFYWQEQGEPGEPASEDLLAEKDYYRVPGLWEGSTAKGLSLSATGYATYRLRVRMPEKAPKSMSLLVSGGMSVCTLWVNNVVMAASGTLGQDMASEKPLLHYVIADSFSPGESLDVVLLVSNFHNEQGGLNGDIRLGSARQIDSIYSIPRLSGAFMGGALLCMSLFYLVLFSLRCSARENLYFGLFCLFWCVAIIFSPTCGFLMTVLVPSLPWEWYINISMLPYGLTVPLLLMFYHCLFPKKYGAVVERVYWVLGLLYIGYILIPPANAYSPILFGYFITGGCAFVYLFTCFFMDLIHREKGVIMLAAGYVALGCAEFDDVLLDLNIVSSVNLRSYGVFIFILSYAVYLSFRFSRAFSESENLSGELESANIQLVRLNKLKDEFLANTTHELKTPLVGMVGIAEALLAGAGGRLSNVVKENLHLVVHSGKRLSKLINDVLDLSRLKHQDIVLHKGEVCLYAAVQRILALSSPLNQDGNLALRSEIQTDFPKLLADQGRLEQILFNLVGNSLKFTEKGEILISATVGNGVAEVSVTDTGIGIPSEDQGRIFNAFEQRDSVGTHVLSGTGLGLSITRHLVELHGGTLRVSSRFGRGSTFSFTLPLYDANVVDSEIPQCVNSVLESEDRGQLFNPEMLPALQDFALTDKSALGGGYQVLVVDDEPVNLHVIVSTLSLAGISFRTARDGVAALRMLEQGDKPEMLLLDVMMPVMNGYEVCRVLRKTHTASALPVILLTVKSRVEDIVEGFAAGANDYLVKPFSSDELVARVTTQLILQKAYVTLEENLNLKRELTLRKKTEHGLRVMQSRLSKILDSLDEAVIAVNQSGEIAFCNQPFEEFTGYRAGSLLGHSFVSLLAEPENLCCRSLLECSLDVPYISKHPCVFENIVLANESGGSRVVSFFVTGLEMEDEPLCLMVVRPAGGSDGRQVMLVSAAMLQELNKNRQRILSLEETLFSLESGNLQGQLAVLDDLKALDALLESMGTRISMAAETGDRRQLAVKVMRLAVDYWSAATGMTKAELAEQSGLWNVYIERDGYFRTQTLDKYFSMETLPRKPRWQKIIVTVDFVLANCDADLPLRRELADAFASLKSLS